jgi:hypothetical protein
MTVYLYRKTNEAPYNNIINKFVNSGRVPDLRQKSFF